MKKLFGTLLIMLLLTTGCSSVSNDKNDADKKTEENTDIEDIKSKIDTTNFSDEQTELMTNMSKNGWELSYEVDKDTSFGTLYLKKDNLQFMFGNVEDSETTSFENMDNEKIVLCFTNYLFDSIPENTAVNPLSSQGAYIYIPSASKNGEESLYSATNPVNNFQTLEAHINPIEEVTNVSTKELVEQKLALTRSNIETYKSEIQEAVKVLDKSLEDINCKDIEEVNALMHNYFISLNK